jgi:hypothetical protein
MMMAMSVTINKGITQEERSREQRINKKAAHVGPRRVVRPRIADEGPKDPKD